MSASTVTARQISLLLVEDNPGDVGLIEEALRENGIPHRLTIAEDGEKAVAVLRKEGASLPDLIVLDLNLPGKSGLEALSEIKRDSALKKIPVIVLTTSSSHREIVRSYENHASCFITKPVDYDQYMKVLKAIADFWFKIVTLPGGK
ncbi:MAG: response regulator [Deltaproteobacteria bacterium]|nr:response regulator [Deltaproteobacteria bacterium]